MLSLNVKKRLADISEPSSVTREPRVLIIVDMKIEIDGRGGKSEPGSYDVPLKHRETHLELQQQMTET